MSKVKLGDIAEIQAGPFGTQLHKDEYVEDGIAMLNAKNIGNGVILTDSMDYVSDAVCDRLPRYVLNKGDILFGRAGSIERHTYITDEFSGCFQGTNCIRIRCKSPKIALYVSYYLWLPELKRVIENKTGGSVLSYITTDLLKNIEINLPDEKSLNLIAGMLFSLDKKVELNKRINDNLQQQLKLMYDYWFVQFDFPDANGTPYHSSGGTMVWNAELQREIPKGWECRSLGDLLIKNSVTFDYQTTEPTIDLSVMPSSSIALNQLNQSDLFATNLFKMLEGDILFGSIRPYLKKAGIAPCDGVVAGTIHSYHVKTDTDYNFVLFTLCRDSFFDYATKVSTGTKMPVVSNESILSYKVAYSHDAAKQFNRIDVQNIICKNVQESRKLAALRDWLLPMLMNGQAIIYD